MKRTILITLTLLSFVGCKSNNNSLAPGHKLDSWSFEEQQLIQIIACCPGQIKAGNEEKCAALALDPDHHLEFNGIRTSRTMNQSNCKTIDETPFWGKL